MSNTGDSNLFARQPTMKDSDDGLAKPKGMQTKIAIAKHLAQKLNLAIDVDTYEKNLQYNQFRRMNTRKEQIVTHWDLKIAQGRQEAHQNQNKREQLIMDDKYIERQETFKDLFR